MISTAEYGSVVRLTNVILWLPVGSAHLAYRVTSELTSSFLERPKKDRYVGSFYDAEEVNALFEAAKGTKLELPILFGAFYGLRRSEAIGLKWDAIDFEQNTITIRHTVTSCDLDGKRILVASDTTKTKSSMRTLPLVPFMRERLLALKEEQQENRRLCGRSYHKLPENIRVVGCWTHARRKFDEALQTLPKEKRKDSLAAAGECYVTYPP